MQTTKRIVELFLLVVFSSALLVAFAGEERLLVSVKKADYEKLEGAIKALGGKVHFKYKYCDMISASVPDDKVSALLAESPVKYGLKDQELTLSDPPWGRGGELQLPDVFELNSDYARVLSVNELTNQLVALPQNYAPLTSELVGAAAFYTETGRYGEGVIVAIIDGGISSGAVAVAPRIVGAENLTDDGIAGDSPLSYPHGTAVACCVGANAIFGFPTFVQDAVKRYAPHSVIPDYFGPGIDGIPMVGTAPAAEFYALKVIRTNGTALLSFVLAGLERAIEMKEKYDQGAGDGVNIGVVNMSLGFANLYQGSDPVFSPLVKRALEAGIVMTVSAGNWGPNGLMVLSPGDCKNILTVGASVDAVHDRILMDIFGGWGPGGGALFRPIDNHLMTDFSSRGPTADGRADPEIVAPGRGRFLQLANGAVTWGNGTSFSAPTVAGAAALLLSAHPGATPNEIRAALLNGANPNALSGAPGVFDQGYGLLDVMNAHRQFGAFNPKDRGRETPLLRANLVPFHVDLITSNAYSSSTGWLEPGERREYFVPTTERPLSGLDVTIAITPEEPSSGQNVIFGDDALVAINSAKTSRLDQLGGGYFAGTKTFALGPEDLDYGLTRVAIMASWTNAGRVKADVTIIRGRTPPRLASMFTGKIGQGDLHHFTFSVSEDLPSMSFVLSWQNGWEAWPTNELDIRLYDPDGNRQYLDNNGDGHWDGAWLDAPERITVYNPVPGEWTAEIQGYTVWSGKEHYMVFSDLGMPPELSKDGVGDPTEGIPKTYVLEQNFPNPFNPSTSISYGVPFDCRVTLAIYNLLGQRLAVLVDEDKPAGYHQVVFTDPGLASGAYMYRFTAGAFAATKKFVLIK